MRNATTFGRPGLLQVSCSTARANVSGMGKESAAGSFFVKYGQSIWPAGCRCSPQKGGIMIRRLDVDYGWGITVVRIIMGFVLIITGYEKLMSGIDKVSATMVKNHILFPRVMAGYITALELVGGVLVVLGWGARWLGILYLAEFIVVSFYVLVPTRGWMDARLPIMLLAGALMLIVAGSGRASLDQAIEKRR
jgi:putative oxidoreductase